MLAARPPLELPQLELGFQLAPLVLEQQGLHLPLELELPALQELPVVLQLDPAEPAVLPGRQAAGRLRRLVVGC